MLKAIRNNLEEKLRKEREEMRRQMFGGIDFLSGGQIKISQGTSKTGWQKFSEKVYQLIDKITPHKDDVKEISAKYDKSIEGFFQFYRFVVSYSIMMFGFFIPLIVFHSIKSSGSDYTTLGNYLPCYFYYSRFQSSIDYIYTITYVGFGIVGMIIGQVQWTQFTINQQRSSIYINEDIYFSKLLFSSWNWNIKSFDESDDSLNLMVNETSTAVYEDLIKDKIKKRPKSEKIKLIIRRAILISINILIILLGVTAIFLVNLYSTSIKNSINVATVVTNQIPSLIVSFVNASVPTMTKKITVLEKYDFRNTLLKQQIWRNFATKILNLSIYTLLNYELAFNKSFFKSSSVISYDSSYSGREDQAGTNLARLVLTEFGLKVIMTFAWMFFNCCKGGCGAKKGWRGEFLVSDEAVWLLYFHTVVWVAIVWNPFMSLIYPFMFYFFFKFIMFKLTKMQKKPLNTTNANDMGNYIMTFLNISFTVIFAFIVIMMSFSLYHGVYSTTKQGGPFTSNKNWQYAIEYYTNKNNTTYYIYYYAKFIPIWWLILVFAVSMYLLKRNTSVVLFSLAKERDKEHKLTISDLERSIAKLKSKIELAKEVEKS